VDDAFSQAWLYAESGSGFGINAFQDVSERADQPMKDKVPDRVRVEVPESDTGDGIPGRFDARCKKPFLEVSSEAAVTVARNVDEDVTV
jgi:hypothetical protein